MKKLVCLISALGKSKEQLVKEAWAAVQKFREAEKMKKDDKKIPEGFVKCEVCGDYNGVTKMKNLNWGDSSPKSSSDELISVSCFCHGILCHMCKKNNIKRPISNSYYEEDNTVWHSPYFTGMRPCRECLEKIAKEKSEKL